MYQAAICEDNPEMLAVLRNALIDKFNEACLEVAFDSFLSGEGLLSMTSKHYHYDIIFMDIEMPGMDGIEVCRRVKEINPHVIIVFISNKDELVFQTFDVQPFRFVRKSLFKETLPDLMYALRVELSHRKERLISLVNLESNEPIVIDVGGIMYVEALGKNCKLCLEKVRYVVRATLSFLMKQLKPYGFIQVHRSYLVNFRYVFHIKKNSICLTNKEEIPLSRHRIEEVKKKFIEYASGE